jgi:hypothetical protein
MRSKVERHSEEAEKAVRELAKLPPGRTGPRFARNESRLAQRSQVGL